MWAQMPGLRKPQFEPHTHLIIINGKTQIITPDGTFLWRGPSGKSFGVVYFTRGKNQGPVSRVSHLQNDLISILIRSFIVTCWSPEWLEGSGLFYSRFQFSLWRPVIWQMNFITTNTLSTHLCLSWKLLPLLLHPCVGLFPLTFHVQDHLIQTSVCYLNC